MRAVERGAVAAQVKPRYVLDGTKFSSFEEFARYFSATVLKDHVWNGNLDAFNDILRGGFGTPDGGFVLEWRHHQAAIASLGSELFETLVEIIRAHGAGGDEAEDGVELELK